MRFRTLTVMTRGTSQLYSDVHLTMHRSGLHGCVTAVVSVDTSSELLYHGRVIDVSINHDSIAFEVGPGVGVTRARYTFSEQ